MEELVSIIVPAYNSQRTIQRCLESLLRQTYRNIEIIVVNDGSSDDTGAVIEQYKEKIIFIEQQNQGVSVARNKGIERAKGKYLVFVDSDDYVSDEYVQSLLEVQEADSKLIVARYTVIFQNGKKEWGESLLDGDFSISASDAEDISKLLENYVLQGPYCKLFCRKIILENSMKFDDTMCFGEDFKFVLDYLNIVRGVHFINQYIYYYCRTPNSLTTGISKKRVDSFIKLSHYFEGFIITNRLENTGIYKFFRNQILRDYIGLNWINFSAKPLEMKEIYNSLKKAPVVKKAKEDKSAQNSKKRFLLFFDFYWAWRFFALLKWWKNKILG